MGMMSNLIPPGLCSCHDPDQEEMIPFTIEDLKDLDLHQGLGEVSYPGQLEKILAPPRMGGPCGRAIKEV